MTTLRTCDYTGQEQFLMDSARHEVRFVSRKRCEDGEIFGRVTSAVPPCHGIDHARYGSDRGVDVDNLLDTFSLLVTGYASPGKAKPLSNVPR